MIESANRKVSALLTSTGSSSMKDDGSRQCSHGSYMKFTPEQKAQIATYTLESGKEPVIVRYSKQCGIVLKESTVRMWKMKYMEGLRKRKLTKPLPIKVLQEILVDVVDVVASYAAFNRKCRSQAKYLCLSGHCTCKDINAKFEHTRNVKAQIAKLKP